LIMLATLAAVWRRSIASSPRLACKKSLAAFECFNSLLINW
jgi:hypothetical protein